MSECKKAQAVDELLTNGDGHQLAENLTVLWERWLTNPETDGESSESRGEMLCTYKALKSFLLSIVI